MDIIKSLVIGQRIRPYPTIIKLTLFLKVILSHRPENPDFSFPCDNNTGSYSRYRSSYGNVKSLKISALPISYQRYGYEYNSCPYYGLDWLPILEVTRTENFDPAKLLMSIIYRNPRRSTICPRIRIRFRPIRTLGHYSSYTLSSHPHVTSHVH